MLVTLVNTGGVPHRGWDGKMYEARIVKSVSSGQRAVA
jgi:hypothetical protein